MAALNRDNAKVICDPLNWRMLNYLLEDKFIELVFIGEGKVPPFLWIIV